MAEPADIVGVGIGFRAAHADAWLGPTPAAPWTEVLVDNYLWADRRALGQLSSLAQRVPVVFHGVGLSLGSADPLDRDYLHRLTELVRMVRPAWVSDHLSFSRVGARHLHDLLPLPRNAETVAHLAERIRQVRDAVGVPVLVENAAAYLEWEASDLDEGRFLGAVAAEADCGLLLDINNVYVSAHNLGWSAAEVLARVPPERVQQMHLAGFEDRGDHLYDTHGQRVHPPVWALYADALARFGPVPACVEWDRDLPEFAVLAAEAHQARAVQARVCDV